VDRARRDLTGWNEESLGRAIQATARADAEVKGGSRDAVFALERMITVIATRAPYGS
jgi:DNA polymerase-3 subunit delta